MRSGLRFNPPQLELSPELLWVLDAAFGSSGGSGRASIDASAALDLARRLSLAHRIGARVREPDLIAALGRDVARTFVVHRLDATARMRPLLTLIPELSDAAQRAGLPLVLLKFGALNARGLTPPGSRIAGDLDVLVPADALGAAVDLLVGLGFGPRTKQGPEHHLPEYVDADGRIVELHDRLPGVRAAGQRRSARFADLEAAGGLATLAGDSTVQIPRADVLAAHLVVHGLAQHGFSPHSYPLTRMLSDLVDLVGTEAPGLLESAYPWIASGVSQAESAALDALCRELTTGIEQTSGPEDEDARLLLRHMLAGLLDERYRSSLRLADVIHPMTDGSRIMAVMRTGLDLLLPDAAGLDRLEGRLGSRFGRAGLLAARPLHLAGRLVTHVASHLRARRR